MIKAILDEQKSEKAINEQIRRIKTESLKIKAELNTSNIKNVNKNINEQVKKTTDATKRTLNTFNAEIERSIAQNKIDKFFRINSKAVDKYAEKISILKSNVQKIVDPQSLKEWNKQFTLLTSDISAAGDLGTTIFGSMAKEAKKFFTWVLSSAGIMMVITSLGKIVDSIFEIDKQITELKKVTDETADVYDRFLTNAANKAKELGTTISGLVEATAIFARLGYTIDEAAKLGEVATIYKNVGDQVKSVEDASEIIISILKSFNIEASESIRIVDALNEVGNRYAIGSSALGEALKRSASALATANNSFEESIGLVTSAYEIVQNAEVVGTALKTISMRLRNTAGSLQEMGEDAEGAAESVIQLQQQIKALSGVDIMLDNNTFKSTYQILYELSQRWSSLSDRARADITRLVAGVRQGNVFSALMTNFANGIRATETALNSQGSALIENQKYLDSLEGRVSKFKATFEALSQTILDSDFIKFLINSGTKILDIIIKIVENLGSIPTLIASISAAFSLLNKNAGKLKRVNMPAPLKAA